MDSSKDFKWLEKVLKDVLKPTTTKLMKNKRKGLGYCIFCLV